MQGGDVSENTEGLSREELGRLVASRWTGENSGQPTEDNDDAVKDVDDENHSERSKDINDEEYGDDDVDSQRYDDDDEADIDDNAEEKTNEDFGDEDHHDDTTYKSDSSDDENEFSGLEPFVPIYIFLSIRNWLIFLSYSDHLMHIR